MKRAPALSFLIKTGYLIPLIISGKGRLPPSERIVDMKPDNFSPYKVQATLQSALGIS
ncbi:hypothetical protein [Brevibacillus laterosporus]|uniref:hypothetical protein n=1 Tax=Brevibacillus laterosporus TaxID=1465 RepID=UPI0003A76EE6